MSRPSDTGRDPFSLARQGEPDAADTDPLAGFGLSEETLVRVETKMQRVAEILVSALPREQLDRLLDEWDERMGAALRPLELSDRPSG
jgi:hypothetical protein